MRKRTDSEKPTRKRRVPFGGFNYKLEVAEESKEPGWHYCWFPDRGAYIQSALDAGYEFVTERDDVEVTNTDVHGGNQSLDGRVERYGGRDRQTGREYNMVLMRQPEEFHQEDIAELAKRNKEVERAILNQEFGQAIERKYGDVKLT